MIKFEFLGQIRINSLLSVLIKDFPLVFNFPELFCKGKIDVFYCNIEMQMTVLTLNQTIQIERAANGLGTI
jgi:hypothetical protein